MNILDLTSLLKRMIIFIVTAFVLFIIFVNIFKIVDFIVKIDGVIDNVTKDDEISPINNNFLSVSEESVNLSSNKAYTAKSLGFVDKYPFVNGSEWGEGINILVVGSDKRNFFESKSRADVIILLRIIKSGKILSLSIPRDTLINVKDGFYAGEYDKIGHSLYWGGLNSLKENVESLVGSPVNKVIIVDNFKSFEAFLSIIGGLNIDKNLNGKLGIQWIRNRHFKLGDIERCKRQQLFLEKAISKIWKITRGGNYFYSVMLYEALKRIIQTDIDKKDFINILYTLKTNGFEPKTDFYNSVLPGIFSTYDSKLMGGKSLACWVANEGAVEKFRFLFYGEKRNFDMFAQNDIKFWSFFKIDIKLFFKNIVGKISKNDKKMVSNSLTPLLD
ncbi:MAG TPA: LCP family protein [Spirochaetota bacterium]|nr:LCP family protein [Spirochaetota bacterium]